MSAHYSIVEFEEKQWGKNKCEQLFSCLWVFVKPSFPWGQGLVWNEDVGDRGCKRFLFLAGGK